MNQASLHGADDDHQLKQHLQRSSSLTGSMRRSVSMSRPCGRFAVGRYPSLDTDTELRRIQRPSKKIEKEDRKTSKPWVTGGLDIEVATDKQGSKLVRWAGLARRPAAAIWPA